MPTLDELVSELFRCNFQWENIQFIFYSSLWCQ